ncbi:MAG: ADP-ribosylation factor-like protein [Oscillospiraceae bacterium]|nr:ADP-ribosylation factor-like protein [Oscillospiraceae bacterium]
MNDEAFKEQIEKELKKMKREQIVFFAWLCAVRALPFIGVRGNFDFWKEKDRKKNLLALFWALDVTVYNRYNTIVRFADSEIAQIAETTQIVEATRTAQIYALVVNTTISSSTSTTDASAIAFAVSAATFAISSVGAIDKSYVYYQKNMKNVLLTDIKDIQNGHAITNNDINWYGKIWESFQKALAEENCSYWGDLYRQMFKDAFVLDEISLQRRLNVPNEIKEQGAAVVASYLEAGKEGVTHLNEARIIILGDKGAGKTCIARKLTNPDAPMTKDEESTAGVDISPWKPQQNDINVHIWDFAGHTVTHAVHKFFLSERCLYILVYDGRAEERNRLEYWLDQIKDYGGDSKVFILVNKRDPYPPEIPINNLKDKYPIVGFYTFSIKDDKENLENFRKEVVECIKNNLSWDKDETKGGFPINYFHVKQELEQRFERDNKCEYITFDDFRKIATKNRIKTPEELLKALDALGICLRYKNLKNSKILVLNPEWISHGIYQIINWAHNREHDRHLISIKDFPNVFENEANRYPADKYEFLFELMTCYELAFETEKENRLIIPHLLHEDRPKILPDFPVGESLMLRYKTEQPLPPNPISRFIVLHNKEIRKEREEFLVWRYGVVLEDENGSIALVRESKEERMISVCVKGINKTAYLDKLRQTLNDIFNSYKSKKPELQYRIETFGQIPEEIENSNPYWQSDRKIHFHHITGNPLWNEYNNKKISVADVINAFLITPEKMLKEEPANLFYGCTFNETKVKNLLNGEKNVIDNSIHNTFTLSNDLRKEIENVIPQIEAIARVLSDEQEEIIDELQRISTQLSKKQPKIPIISSALQEINTVLCGAAGSFIVDHDVLAKIKHILEGFGILN